MYMYYAAFDFVHNELKRIKIQAQTRIEVNFSHRPNFSATSRGSTVCETATRCSSLSPNRPSNIRPLEVYLSHLESRAPEVSFPINNACKRRQRSHRDRRAMITNYDRDLGVETAPDANAICNHGAEERKKKEREKKRIEE